MKKLHANDFNSIIDIMEDDSPLFNFKNLNGRKRELNKIKSIKDIKTIGNALS